MTTEFENQLDAAIEKEALEYFLSDPELRCDYSFKTGANLLKPLLLLAMKQRDSLRMDCPGYDLAESENKEILKMIGDV